MAKWLEDRGAEEDVVVSTRVRVARNLYDYKFPQLLNVGEADEITNKILNIMKESKENYDFHRIKDMKELDKRFFVEKHIISPTLVKSSWRGSFFVREDEKITIMVNEEDQLRIQVLFPGFNLEEAWDMCSDVDDFIEKDLDYAFDEKFGYLTACPTNVGTGLRASSMLHLPAITITNNLNNLIESLRKLGFTMRGMYGEGTKGLGNLYQISNQTTLGQSEKEIINKLDRIIRQIISRERGTRRYLLKNRQVDIEDKIFRALGTLKYSRKIKLEESMFSLSYLKLGRDLGIIENFDSKDITRLMLKIQPANIQIGFDKDLSNREIEVKRANLIRKYIEKWEEN